MPNGDRAFYSVCYAHLDKAKGGQWPVSVKWATLPDCL